MLLAAANQQASQGFAAGGGPASLGTFLKKSPRGGWFRVWCLKPTFPGTFLKKSPRGRWFLNQPPWGLFVLRTKKVQGRVIKSQASPWSVCRSKQTSSAVVSSRRRFSTWLRGVCLVLRAKHCKPVSSRFVARTVLALCRFATKLQFCRRPAGGCFQQPRC